MPKTGATRYQKFLKSEKAKTKLKSKKELPRGTNETKTNFKVKKIIIQEQLKQHSKSEILSKKNLSLQELLRRLNHFNVNSISEGINGLKEMLVNHKELISNHLGDLINGVIPLVIHIEKVVRHESFKLIYLILSKCETMNLLPFSEVLNSYLRCAMTHINSRIQEDSLLYVDVLLTTAPDILINNFHKVMPSFMDMMSKLKHDSKIERTLTVNMNSQQTSQKWRVKVLYRLQQFLASFLKMEKHKEIKGSISTTQYFNESIRNTFPLNDSLRLSNCSMPCFSQNDEEGIVDEEGMMKKHIENLMPLLFDSWIEAGPSTTNKSEGQMETILSEETATHLKHIIEIILVIVDIIPVLKQSSDSSLLKWLGNKYINNFSRYFFDSFPYITSFRNRNDKNIIYDEPITDMKMVIENLKLCNIYVCMQANLNKKNMEAISKTIQYVEKVFVHSNDEHTAKTMITLLQNLFSREAQIFIRNADLLKSFLDKIISLYQAKQFSVYLENEIFSLLCTISLDKKLSPLQSSKLFTDWQKNLTDILCGEKITSTAINTLQQVAIQNRHLFNKAIKPILPKVIKNISKILVVGNNERDLRTKLLCLLYWINGWDKESLDILGEQLVNSSFSNSESQVITEILQIKVEGTFLFKQD